MAGGFIAIYLSTRSPLISVGWVVSGAYAVLLMPQRVGEKRTNYASVLMRQPVTLNAERRDEFVSEVSSGKRREAFSVMGVMFVLAVAGLAIALVQA
jgi:hypothetical protein